VKTPRHVCNDGELVKWKLAENFCGPDKEGWCIEMFSGGDVYYVNIDYCPLCGVKLEETKPDPGESTDDDRRIPVLTGPLVLNPCADIPGEWLIHDLATDLFTQGGSPEEALSMLRSLYIDVGDWLREESDLHCGEKPAPPECWPPELFDKENQHAEPG